MYVVFADAAEKEGFRRAADTFHAINVAEKQHEIMFRELAENLSLKRAFIRSEQVRWKCLNCGYLHTGEHPPDKCPACIKPASFFEIFIKNW
jgi:rubrerythrin